MRNVTVLECKDGIKTDGNVEVDMTNTEFKKIHGQFIKPSNNPEVPQGEEATKTNIKRSVVFQL